MGHNDVVFLCCDSDMVYQIGNGAMVQYLLVMVNWCNGAMKYWYSEVMVQWPSGAM